MARGEQLARQWRILQSLMTSRQGKSVAELAADLNCHRRTVYRDLEALQYAGFPIYTDQVEGRHLWSLLESVKSRMPIPLTFTELMALYFSRGMLKPLEDTMFHDALESLFQKIRATLPGETVDYLDGVDQVLRVNPGPRKIYGRHRDVIDKVNRGIIERRCLDVVYFTMSRRKETRRRIAPYRIWYFEGALYIVGHCYLRRTVRIFAMERIRSAQLTEDRFPPPDLDEVESFLRSGFGAFAGKPVRVRILFSRDVAGYIQERIWHDSQQIVPLENGDVIFEARMAGLQEVKYWVLRWGRRAEILEPDFLREEIMQEAEAISRRYEAGASKSTVALEPAGTTKRSARPTRFGRGEKGKRHR